MDFTLDNGFINPDHLRGFGCTNHDMAAFLSVALLSLQWEARGVRALLCFCSFESSLQITHLIDATDESEMHTLFLIRQLFCYPKQRG